MKKITAFTAIMALALVALFQTVMAADATYEIYYHRDDGKYFSGPYVVNTDNYAWNIWNVTTPSAVAFDTDVTQYGAHVTITVDQTTPTDLKIIIRKSDVKSDETFGTGSDSGNNGWREREGIENQTDTINLGSAGGTFKIESGGGNGATATIKEYVLNSDTTLTDFPNLSAYTGLEKVFINGSSLTNVEIPDTLPDTVTTLAMTEGAIETINLSNATGLVELYLYKNNISSIDVSGLTNLTTLDISNNKITDISSAKDLNNLYYVDVQKNLLNLNNPLVVASIDEILATTTGNNGKLFYQPQDATPTLYGDVNNDGTAGTAADLLYLRRHIVGDTFAADEVFDAVAADVYYDNTTDLQDVLALRRYIVRWYSSLPITPTADNVDTE
jgi:Leucine-rich repeat (LRR) protein